MYSLLLQDVDTKGPAQFAGLRVGDLITHINGEVVQGLMQPEILPIMCKTPKKVSAKLLKSKKFFHLYKTPKKRNS